MSVSMWSYRPEVCDGEGCPRDCDLCNKPRYMEDGMTDYIKREDALQDIDNAHANIITQRGYKDYWSADSETQLVCDGLAKAIEAVFDTLSADVVEGDKAQKEIDYWHDKSQSYEQTILKLSLNKADVVEVVRCKDCLHGSWCEDVLWCNITDEPMTENDFCSKGDRI